MLEGRLPNRFPGCDCFASGLWSVHAAAAAAPHRVESLFVAQMFSGRSEQYWRLPCLRPLTVSESSFQGLEGLMEGMTSR